MWCQSCWSTGKSRLAVTILLVLLLVLAALVAQTHPAAAANTPAGSNVTVTPSYHGSQAITITFATVTGEGQTEAHTVQCGSSSGGSGTGVRLSAVNRPLSNYCHTWFGKTGAGFVQLTWSWVGATNMGHLFYYNDILRYPVTAGNSWTGEKMFFNDYDYVEGLAQIEGVSEVVFVPAGTFTCVKISKTFSYSYTPNSWDIASQQLWLAQGVGPVKAVSTYFGGTTVNGELVDYSLSSPAPNDYFPSAVGNSWQFQWDSPPNDEVYEVTETWVYPDLHPYYVQGPTTIFTTATYEGPVSLALHYEIPSWLSYLSEQDLRLFQWDGAQWIDITTSVNDATDTIYAETDMPLSVFFVGPANNTSVGSNVVIDPLAYVQPGFASLSFNTISMAGFTRADIYSQLQPSWGPVPQGFGVVGEMFMDVKTTATYTGPITGEMHYGSLVSQIVNESDLKVFHWNGTSWEDVTTGVDTANDIIYVEVSSLSPFFLGDPVGGGGSVPVFPNIYIGIMAALGAGVLAYFVRRRLVKQE